MLVCEDVMQMCLYLKINLKCKHVKNNNKLEFKETFF